MELDYIKKPNIAVMITKEQYELFFAQIKKEFESRFNLQYIDIQNLNSVGYGSDKLADRLNNVEGCITSWGTPTIDKALLDLMPELEIIVHAAGSIKKVISNRVFKKGIAVSSCHMALAPTVAETTMMLTLMGLKLYQRQRNRLEKGQNRTPELVAHDLIGKTVGLVGYGRIARAYRALLKGFEVDVLVYDPYLKSEDISGENVTLVELEQLLKQSNVISLHAPGIKANDCLIDAAALSMMQDQTLIVNTARGILIDEEALFLELKNGRLRAAMDVFRTEPLPLESPLRELDNVILTPHIGGISLDSRKRIGQIVMSELGCYFAGGKLLYQIQPETLNTRA